LLEEERRIFYVAMTRAKDELYMITEKGNESMFLKEIPKKYTERIYSSSKPIIEDVVYCKECNIRLTEKPKYCPNCGLHQNYNNT
jgi:ATP-dependent exoDNAse (exonuclease V) beta subunit